MVFKNNTLEMLKRLFSFTLFACFATLGFSQTPSPVKFTKSQATNVAEDILACTGIQEAGTVSLGPFVGSSNDVDFDTMYLCFNDQILIDHDAGSESLAGDPNPATTPGVGYAFYDCPPTAAFNGTVEDIRNDPCLTDTPLPPAGTGALPYVAFNPDNSGDVAFINNGILQTFFGGGAPILKWFAPITYDQLELDIVTGEVFPSYEGTNVIGNRCADVNGNVAFPVVYLNAIDTSNLDITGCSGQVNLSGGLPEFESNANYSVSMTLDGNPSVMGEILSIPNSGGLLRFKVNESGSYNIVITDEKGCPALFQVNMTACDIVDFNIPNVNVTGTGTQICVPVTVDNFVNVQSFQFSINWDPSILEFASVNYVGISQNDVVIVPNGNNYLTTSFFFIGATPGLTLTDGETVFEICFNALGPVGSSSFVDINGDVTIIDIFDGDGNQMGINVNNGSVTVVNQATFDINVTPTDVSCNGGMDGSFEVTVVGAGGGTAPYTVSYSEVGNAANNGSIGAIPNNGTVTQSGLVAGEYALVINDASMPPVTDLDTIIIGDPPQLGANLGVEQPILCFGDTNGSLTAVILSGGSPVNNPGPEYSFLWTPGNVTTQMINNVDPSLGTYSVTITNGNGCTAVASGTPSQPNELEVDVMVTDAACSGINNGEITATGMGGRDDMPYTYEWSTTPIQTTATATNLEIGTYTVTITDFNNCVATATGIVSAATIISANATFSDITCNGLNDGAISFDPQVIGVDNGGYTYQWTPTVSTTNAATGLVQGTYTTTITDILGCNIDTTITLTEPEPIQIVGGVITTDETCTVGNDGTATISVTGGTPNALGEYTYTWSCCPTVMDSVATGISQGTNYTVVVEDANGCNTTTETFDINPPISPTITGYDSTSVSCPTDTNGELTVMAMEGNAPIASYLWTFPSGATAMGATISNLGPGTYTVLVTSTDGCTVTGSTSLFAPTPLVILEGASANPSCFGNTDGTATVQANGATAPYTYQWSANANSATTSIVPQLGAGTYTVTVTDSLNCGQEVLEVVLENPDSITVVFDNVMPVSCFGSSAGCDGSAMALVSGGAGAPYTFSWESGEIETGVSSTAIALCQGFQSVTVQDGNGCNTTVMVNVPAPPALSVLPTYTQPTCNGDVDGAIMAMGTGGTPMYTYDFGNGNTNNTLSGIAAGDFPITVTDMNNCVFDTILTLLEPEILEAELDSTENVSCSGESDGFIRVSFQGGNGGTMTYDWSGGVAPVNSNTATGLAPGTYTVTISDMNGCSDEVSYQVDEPTPINADIPPAAEPLCNGDQTLLTVVAATGGAGAPYTFTIDGGPSQNIGTTISVFAGDHTIVVSDITGCSYVEDIFINEPAPIIIDLGPDIEIQLGESTTLNPVLTGSAVPIDSIIWTPSILDSLCMNCLQPTVAPIDDQLYIIEIFDVNGCTGTDDIFVEVDKNRNVYIPNVFTPNGDGFNDEFLIFTGPGVEIIKSVQVFDRWGELVFERGDLSPSANPDFATGWDGRLNGRIMNPGVFVYLVEVAFEDGVSLLFRGDVTLLH